VAMLILIEATAKAAPKDRSKQRAAANTTDIFLTSITPLMKDRM